MTDIYPQCDALSALGEPIAHLNDAQRLLKDFEKRCAGGDDGLGVTRPEKRGRDGALQLEVGTHAVATSNSGGSTDVGVVTKVSNGYYHVRFVNGQRCLRRHQLSALVEPERKRPRSAEPASSCADSSFTGMIGRTVFLTDSRAGLCESLQGGILTVNLYTSSARVARVSIPSSQIDLERTQTHAAASTRPSVPNEMMQTSDVGKFGRLLKRQATNPSYSAGKPVVGHSTKKPPTRPPDKSASALQRLAPEARALLLATAQRLGAKTSIAGDTSLQSYQLTKLDVEELRTISAARHTDGFLSAPSDQQRGVSAPAHANAANRDHTVEHQLFSRQSIRQDQHEQNASGSQEKSAQMDA
eukprot:COSAG02_NODE_289_length_25587_cov_34.270323_7_plen_357_part_00